MKAEVKYIDKLQLRAVADSNHSIILDSNKKLSHDQGIRPQELILMSIAGCTGMDVLSLLYKMRVKFNDFSVSAEGKLTKEHPRQFKYINLQYRINGNSIDESKLKKAIKLSQERYCGVSALLRKVIDIDYSYIIEKKE